MKNATLYRRIFDITMLVLLLTASVWVWEMASVSRKTESALRVAAPLADRSSVQDRLIGTRLSLPDFVDGLGKSPQDRIKDGDALLLWIVDLTRCPTCLESGFAVWNALAEDPSLERRLLVVGDGRVPEYAQRAIRGTEFASLSREELHAALGPIPPNTKVLIDGGGTVLMADARTDALECGWSFEAQVGALRGVFASSVIRSQP